MNTVVERCADVVWRLAADRVLVRRVDDWTDEGAADLMRTAALVWIALDEPGTPDDVAARIGDALDEQVPVDSALDDLLDAGWLTAR